jgi:hypothetical protein
MKLWQLRKLSTNEALNEPQELPENWGPIFGLTGFKDKLNDLSWVGLEDQGWFETSQEVETPYSSSESIQWNKAKILLKESDWSILPDVPMVNSKRTEWIEYRKALREIKLQTGFPDSINWPQIPE